MAPIFFRVSDDASLDRDDLVHSEWAPGVKVRRVEDDTVAPPEATHYVEHPWDEDFSPGIVMVLMTLLRNPLVEGVWCGDPPVPIVDVSVVDIVDDYIRAQQAGADDTLSS